jgi:hypothetical protein
MQHRFLSSLLSIIICISIVKSAFANTVYLPTNSSDQWLPTIKILSYSFNYGDLEATALGSGTLIDNQGTVLTNNHVIENYYDTTKTYDAMQICFTKSNDTENPVCEFTAKVLGRDKEKDLALIKIDDTDVQGNKINFDFFLPYDNDSNYQIGDEMTAIGYPSVGGKTITYTKGVISGFLNVNNIDYIKTDAEISFGNSGGTAVDKDGNFIGIPTFIDYSETLGYLFPIKNAISWINENINNEAIINEAAYDTLKNQILTFITANSQGFYQNEYPPYKISIVDGWKTTNNLEGAFDYSNSLEASSDVLTIYPENRTSTSIISLNISIRDYAYEITLDEVKSEISATNYEDQGMTNELQNMKLNDKYDVIKQTNTYIDWYYLAGEEVTQITYYLPYGDKIINIAYSYSTSDEAKVTDIESMIKTFELDMAQINFKQIDKIENQDPFIIINKPASIKNLYLSDDSYEYDYVKYFAASFGKKKDPNFYASISNGTYYEGLENFAKLKDETLKYINESELISQGKIIIDGKNGFYFTTKYDYGYSEASYYSSIYIENDENSYFAIYYSGTENSYKNNLQDFKIILKNIQFSESGNNKYLIPNLAFANTKNLEDIENYLYEQKILNLNKEKVFGEKSPIKFAPADNLTRKDFIVWAVKSLHLDDLTEFEAFKKPYSGCTDNCFQDIDYNSNDAIYIAFAYKKGAVQGNKINDALYLKPDDNISLAAALKIISKLYNYSTWKAPEFLPWYIPYIQFGYEYGLIPYGINDSMYELTRGEGAYIIETLMTNKYYGGYYY